MMSATTEAIEDTFMTVKQFNVTAKRMPENAPHNYTLRDSNDNTIARVQWLNVNGVRMAFGNGTVTLAAELEIRFANSQFDSEGEVDAAGAFIEVNE